MNFARYVGGLRGEGGREWKDILINKLMRSATSQGTVVTADGVSVSTQIQKKSYFVNTTKDFKLYFDYVSVF